MLSFALVDGSGHHYCGTHACDPSCVLASDHTHRDQRDYTVTTVPRAGPCGWSLPRYKLICQRCILWELGTTNYRPPPVVIWRSPASSLRIHPLPSNGFGGLLVALIGSCLPAAPSSPRMRVNSHPANPPTTTACLGRSWAYWTNKRGSAAPTSRHPPGTVRPRLRTAIHPYCSTPLRTLRNRRVVCLSSIESSYIVHGNVRRRARVTQRWGADVNRVLTAWAFPPCRSRSMARTQIPMSEGWRSKALS